MIQRNILVWLAVAAVCFYILLSTLPTGGLGIGRLINLVPKFNCSTLEDPKFISDENHITTALASFPGSGNTYTRTLIAKGTGVKTGDVYIDKNLQDSAFATQVFNNSVSVFKTHWPYFTPSNKWKQRFYTALYRAVLLIRNPRDAIVSEYSRKFHGGSHIDMVSIDGFRGERGILKEWEERFMTGLDAWYKFHTFWLIQYKGTLDVVYYENLVSDCEVELNSIISFIKLKPPNEEERLTCACTHAEEYHRKKHQPIDLITSDEMRLATNKTIHKLIGDIRNSGTPFRGFPDAYMNNDVW